MVSFFKFLLAVAFVVLLLPMTANAEPWGIGVMVGEPTGLSVKHQEKPENAMAFGFAFEANDFIHLHGDYLFNNNFYNTEDNSIKLDTYYGLGALICIDQKDDYEWKRGYKGHYYKSKKDKEHLIGPRVPLGVNADFPTAQVEVFAEAALVVTIYSKTSVDVDAALGVRYEF